MTCSPHSWFSKIHYNTLLSKFRHQESLLSALILLSFVRAHIGHAIAQAVGQWPLNMKAWVQSMWNLWWSKRQWLCSKHFSFTMPIIISQILHTHIPSGACTIDPFDAAVLGDSNPTAAKQYLGRILLIHELKYSPLLTPMGSSFPPRVHLSLMTGYVSVFGCTIWSKLKPWLGQTCCRSHSSNRICTLLYQIIMKILDSASCLLHFGRHFLLNARLGYAGDETSV
jgi:hypothetical protein